MQCINAEYRYNTLMLNIAAHVCTQRRTLLRIQLAMCLCTCMQRQVLGCDAFRSLCATVELQVLLPSLLHFQIVMFAHSCQSRIE